MKRIAAAIVLLWRLCASVVRSGWHVSWRILRRPRDFAPCYAEYRLAPMGPGATTVLACMVSLTPGTTAVEVDAVAGRIRLHVLDGEAVEHALHEIRIHFEDPVRVLFTKGNEA